MSAIVLALLIGIPVASWAIVAGLTAAFLQVGLVLAMAGYLLGIPYAVWFRQRHGRWPRYE